MQQATENKNRSQDAYRYMPCYNLLPKHINQTYDKGQSTDLANGSGSMIYTGITQKQ